MNKFEESNFYKALQDFFINHYKTFLLTIIKILFYKCYQNFITEQKVL